MRRLCCSEMYGGRRSLGRHRLGVAMVLWRNNLPSWPTAACALCHNKSPACSLRISTRGQGPHRPRTSYNKSTSLPTHGITQSEIKIATRPKPGCTSHRPPAPSLPRMPLRRSGPQRTSRFPSGHRGVSCSCIVIPYVRGELTCEGGRRRLTLLLVARRPPLCPERTRRRDSLHSSLRIEV